MEGKIWMEQCPNTPLEGAQVIGRWKYRQREAVPLFTSERNEEIKMLVNSCKEIWKA